MKNRKFFVSMSVLLIVHSVGVAGFTLGYSGLMAVLTPWNLLLTLFLLLWMHGTTKGLTDMFVVAVLAVAVECVGVNTGWPFGNYVYGEALGPKWLNTPPLIGVNWLILAYGANALAAMVSKSRPGRAVAAAGLMTLLDAVMEPVAIRLEFWAWAAGDPPLLNYAGWFFTALLLSLIWQWKAIPTQRDGGVGVMAIQAGFFATMRMMV